MLAATASIGVTSAAAQTPAMRLLEAGRVQIDELNGDSAFALVQAGLAQSTTEAERIRGFTLLAFTELMRGSQVAARQAFEQALRLDLSLRVDSLLGLHSDAPLVFAQARQIAGPAPEAPVGPSLSVTLDVPADTIVPAADPRLRITLQPSYRARVTAVITPADLPGVVIWGDTQVVGGVRTAAWTMRGADGGIVAPGRYTLRVHATDSLDRSTLFVERTVQVARAPVDTQPHPAPLTATNFEPDTVYLRGGGAGALAWGLALGAAVAAAPSLLGNPDVNDGQSADGTAYLVAGGVAVAGVVGFLAGSRARAMPENIRRNSELRERHRQETDAVIRGNAQAREEAGVHVTLERTGP